MSRNSHLNDKTRLLDTHLHESQAGAYSRVNGVAAAGSIPAGASSLS